MPLIAWIGFQLAAACLGVSDVRLWSHHPIPPSGLALAEMIVAQVAVSSLIFPALLSTWRSAVVAVSTAAAFLAASMVIANAPAAHACRAAVAVLVWLISLSLLGIAVRNRPAMRQPAVVIISAWTLGSLLLSYLIANQPDVKPSRITLALSGGPILTALGSQSAFKSIVTILAVPIAAAAVVLAAEWVRRTTTSFHQNKNSGFRLRKNSDRG